MFGTSAMKCYFKNYSNSQCGKDHHQLKVISSHCMTDTQSSHWDDYIGASTNANTHLHALL